MFKNSNIRNSSQLVKFFGAWAGMAIYILAMTTYLHAATHYVRKDATGANDGSSWTDAWSEMNQINWAGVNPGDVVLIGEGTYTTRLVMSKAGSGPEVSQRIIVKKAAELPYNGSVRIPAMTVTAPYTTLDGVDRSKFTITAPLGNGILVHVDIGVPTLFFELRNVYVTGVSANSTRGVNRMVRVFSGSLFIDGCEFYGIHGIEDQIIMTSLGNGESLHVENSIFRHWPSMYIPDASWSPPWSHSDLFQDYCGTSDCYRGDLIFKYNLVDDSGIDTPTETYRHDVFMNSDTHYNSVDIQYNVFKSASDVVKIKSARAVRITNNVFADGAHDFACYTTCEPRTIANNIYYFSRGAAASNTNSIWVPGNGWFTPGNGNREVDPLVMSANSIFGADNIPFTADDGFNIQPGSPAIDMGINLDQTRDITGIGTRQGAAWDIGAYEYCPSGDCPRVIPPSPPIITPPPGTTPPPGSTPPSEPLIPSRDGFLAISVPSPGIIEVMVFDRQGQKIKTLWNGEAPSNGQVLWNGKNNKGSLVASGIYSVLIKSASKTEKRKVVIIK